MYTEIVFPFVFNIAPLTLYAGFFVGCVIALGNSTIYNVKYSFAVIQTTRLAPLKFAPF